MNVYHKLDENFHVNFFLVYMHGDMILYLSGFGKKKWDTYLDPQYWSMSILDNPTFFGEK